MVISIQSVACISGNDSFLTEARESSSVSNELLYSGLHSGFLSLLFSSASEKTIVVTREEEIWGKKSA